MTTRSINSIKPSASILAACFWRAHLLPSEKIIRYQVMVFLSFMKIIFQISRAQESGDVTPINVGVILDMDSWVGKVSNSYMEMAVSDFYATYPNYKIRLDLHTRDSKSDVIGAAFAGVYHSSFVYALIILVYICRVQYSLLTNRECNFIVYIVTCKKSLLGATSFSLFCQNIGVG